MPYLMSQKRLKKYATSYKIAREVSCIDLERNVHVVPKLFVANALRLTSRDRMALIKYMMMMMMMMMTMMMTMMMIIII